mmetsp:Transcript_42086/g.45688  ORF Transcript_42086/g.45688 Transcript_42086/m.45688 type:complete len:89 (+) Transcript_42086:110-376(+)
MNQNTIFYQYIIMPSYLLSFFLHYNLSNQIKYYILFLRVMSHTQKGNIRPVTVPIHRGKAREGVDNAIEMGRNDNSLLVYVKPTNTKT